MLAEFIVAERGEPVMPTSAKGVQADDAAGEVTARTPIRGKGGVAPADHSLPTQYPRSQRRTVTKIGSFELDRSTNRVKVAEEEIPLSDAEFIVLSILTRWPGYVVSLEDFKKRWRPTVQSDAIHTAVWGLRHKLKAKTCIVSPRRVGWRFDGLPSDRAIVDAYVAADPKMIEQSGVRLSPGARRVWVGDREVDLRPIEFKLLMVLMTDAGRDLPREEIESRVWHNVSPTPVRLHLQISNLRKKLGEEGPRLIDTFGSGYRFRRTATVSDRVVGAVFGRVLRGVGDPAVAGAITAEAVGRVDGVVADADDVESVGELFVAADVVMVERLR
ncbi:winged helix-turn-helix domain-containing protein, partial [Nocardia sp. NPDC004568]|uniref:winged helix-turn-helix domain-containing protein n=1 Tax=Nocardia sp. NPDC004568 TaxID=3154551 RepID=UPI00339DD32C